MGTALDLGVLLHKRYRIVEILGQGGMGAVYRAVDENLGVEVAVKENLYTSDEYVRQFRLEAVILANLRHPNLPRVTDSFVIAGQGQYLVMDFIKGEDLRQRLEKSGPISQEETILVGAAMCDALHYLHTSNPSVIHRDVKPGNVRITPDGHIYLVDFGLAKLVKGGQVTNTAARAITPGYSPPEQYGTAGTDARTDIYSLGATLYAALTGFIPEDGLVRAMDNVELVPLRRCNPKIPRKLANAIEKALALRPEDRFQTAQEFKLALAASAVKMQRMNGKIVLESTPQAGETGENEKLSQEIPPAGNFLPPGSRPLKPRQGRGRSSGVWIFFALVILSCPLPGHFLLVTHFQRNPGFSDNPYFHPGNDHCDESGKNRPAGHPEENSHDDPDRYFDTDHNAGCHGNPIPDPSPHNDIHSLPHPYYCPNRYPMADPDSKQYTDCPYSYTMAHLDAKQYANRYANRDPDPNPHVDLHTLPHPYPHPNGHPLAD